MNKGFLLKTFSFNFANEPSGSSEKVLQENNSMYLYKKGDFKDNFIDGSVSGGAPGAPDPPGVEQANQLRFRYAVLEMFKRLVAFSSLTLFVVAVSAVAICLLH